MAVIGGLPARRIGVVRAANRVEVELLEKVDVGQHALLSYRLPTPLIVLVPVHTLHQNGPSVHQQLPALDHHLPETHLPNTPQHLGVRATRQQMHIL